MNTDQGPAAAGAEPRALGSAGRDRAPILDVGVGDPEAAANAIPNIIAQLVETETWRNAATVITGLLLIGLGYWAYHGIRHSVARLLLCDCVVVPAIPTMFCS